jgi:molybdopterin adenylyltransferase
VSEKILIGILTISDRASAGVYEPIGGQAIEQYLRERVVSSWQPVQKVIPDGIESVRDALIALADGEGCALILTTGGTGPAPRDLTPEATEAVCSRIMPGFGELMRKASLDQVPTAILSRQCAGIRGRTLIVNLPGRPNSIRICLDAVFPAIPYCLDLIGSPGLDTEPRAFRPAA